MRIIMFNERYIGMGIRVRLGPLLAASFVMLVFVLAAGMFTGGVFYARSINDQSLEKFYGNTSLVLQREMEQQRESLQVAREQAEQQLNALAVRLSLLHGHVLRLDALGARLAAMAELGDFEFGYDNPPGMGGPVSSLQNDMAVNDFIHALDQLAAELDVRDDKLAAIERLLLSRSLRKQTVPSGMPVKSGWISSLFGNRTNPFSGRWEMHEGIDFAGRPGTKILTVADGVVTWSGHRGDYGKLVEISHGDGYVTRYAHNKKNLVKVGERVTKGQPVALMGSTGRSTGTHVHFEVLHDGKPVNPKKYISVH